jgi:hypothetical protein
MNFQMIVLTVAIITLIITLVVIGLALSKASDAETWPPVVGTCPDYWLDMSGNGEECLNTHSLGRCNLPSESNKSTMNFNKSPFNTDSGNCAKYKWATSCQVTWDGITSGVKNPCDTSTQDTTS